MKKNQIILALVSIALLLGNPAILAQEREQKEHISKLKEQYNKFKDAFSCVRKRGWQDCDAEEKKKIKQAVGALIVLVIVTYIGYRGLGWYKRRILREERPVLREERPVWEEVVRKEWATDLLYWLISGVDLMQTPFGDPTQQTFFNEKEQKEFKEADVPTKIKILLNAGADPNAQRRNIGQETFLSLLYIAVNSEDLGVVNALLAAPDIKVNIKSFDETPLDLARFKFGEDHPISKALEDHDAMTSADLAEKEKKAGKEEEL